MTRIGHPFFTQISKSLLCSLLLALPINACAQNSPDHSLGEASVSVATPESNEKAASLDELLEAGKAEWMENATPEYGEDTEFLWEDSLDQIRKVGAESLDGDIANDLKRFTPNMVTKFSKLSDDQYPFLESLGKEIQAKAREDEAKAREDEAKAREERFKKLAGSN